MNQTGKHRKDIKRLICHRIAATALLNQTDVHLKNMNDFEMRVQLLMD
jgi:hypothetical protein